MKNIDKKIIIKFSVSVFVLLLLITGATYAYFKLNANINNGSTNISSELEDPGTVALISGDNLYMDISYDDMRNVGYDEIYYASSNGKTTVKTEEVIAYTQITGKSVYNCTYTLEVTDESTNSIYTAFQNMENKSEGQIVLTINGVDYDFNTSSLFPLTINGTFENIWSRKAGEITAKLKLVNNSKVDQSGFAGTDIDIAFNVTQFDCEVNEKEYLANIVKENTTEYYSKKILNFKESDYSSLSVASYTMEGEFYDSESDEYTSFSDSLTSNFTYDNEMWNLSILTDDYENADWFEIPSLSYTFDISTDGINDYMVCFDTSDIMYSDLFINVDSLYSDDNGDDTVSSMSIDSLYCYNLGILSEGKHTIEIYYDYIEIYGDLSFGFNVTTFESINSVGYRYSGKTPNNYVTFNGETWRIIGLIPTCTSSGCATSENLVKIIRNTSLGTIAYDAKSSDYTGAWGSNTLYTLLNNYYYGAQDGTGTDYCYSTKNTTTTTCDYTSNGIDPNGFYGQMIKNVYWNTGASTTKVLANLIYTNEVTNQTVSGYIGLANPSDYVYATISDYHNTLLNVYNSSRYSNNWFANGLTLTQYTTSSQVITLASSYLSYTSAYSGSAVRPVVYLDKDVYITEGDGSSTNPYQIAI